MFPRGISYVVTFVVCAVIVTSVRSAKVRQAVLLLASYTLYIAWAGWFTAILLTSTILNYFLGQLLRRKPSGAVLAIGILLNLVLLSAFKYLPPIAVAMPFSSLQKFAHLALPLGISFWTFQAMSYLFDLYRGEEIDPSLTEFALYMAFFPVTISGPICRMPEMLPQFRSEDAIPWASIGQGLRRIAIGVLMMTLARVLGQGILAGDGINSGFDRAGQWSGPDAWCLAFGYGLQLFFDFAGYSHIAIGAAQALGLSIPENFARPFQSQTVSVFWTRWHMSLSFWIRDYVFLPLATLRREVWWRNLALVISMVLFGVWHKAAILFLLWGTYHGILLVVHRQVQQLQRRLDWNPSATWWNLLSWVVTISSISIGWIFFRSNTLTQARQMLSSALTPATYAAHSLSGSLFLLVGSLALGYALVLFVIDTLDANLAERDVSQNHQQSGFTALAARMRWYWIPPLYSVTLLFALMVALARGTATAQFMYGNF
jgi:alginate O-acetyltransferase complex protein AlgI